MVEIPEAFNYQAIRRSEQMEKFAAKIIKDGVPFGFDIETGNSGSPKETRVALKPNHPNWLMVGFSFTNSLQWARYVPVAHDDGDNIDDVQKTARALWRMLATGLGVAHNASFELKCLSLWFRNVLWDDPEVGQEVRDANGYFPVRSDTMIETFLWQEYHPMTVGQKLKGLVKHIFGHQMILFDELFSDLLAKKLIKRDSLRFNILPVDPRTITYGCEDSLWCLALHLEHYDKVKDSLVYKTEMALLQVCAEMEEEGILLNWDAIESKDQEVIELRELMNEEIQGDLSERLGEAVSINLNSPAQVADVLYTRMGLEITSRNKETQSAKTDEKTLRGYAQTEPIVSKILKYREISKLHNSYLGKYLKELHYAESGRAYPNHKQTGTVTGRFSVDGVAYQQWPKPYHYELASGKKFDLNFRDLMLAPQGFRVIGFDYSQVEMRVLAGAAQETSLLEAFARGEDLHRATASRMLNIPLDEVTDKQRSVGKTLNFAIVYGSTAVGIAQQLVCSEREAQEKLDQYFAAFPKIKKWMDLQVLAGRAQGYITNMFGRKVTVWDYKDRRQWVRNNGDRFCGNAPIQGGAADYFKIAMVRANKAIKRAGLQDKIKMVVTFHDALEFYVSNSLTTQEVIDLLSPAVSFRVKGLPDIRADWHEGYQWGSVAEVSMEDGQVSGYSRKVELADKSAMKWTGEELHEVLTPFYDWAAKHFGSTYHDQQYYLSQAPDQSSYVPETAAAAPEKKEESKTEHTSQPQRVEVTLLQMPKRSQWEKFQQFLSERPGDMKVEVVTPQGSIVFDTLYEISDTETALISMAFNGARVEIRDDLSLEEVLAQMEEFSV